MTLVNARRFTRDEYYLMAESGVFGPEEHVELIEGEIVAMTPQNYAHSGAITRINMVLTRAYGHTHVIRVQCPLSLGDKSEPEPDFAVVSIADFELSVSERRQPRWAPLVVEVAHSSLQFDRKEKCSLYALHGIPEYWLVNVAQNRLEIHRQPEATPGAVFGHDYGIRLIVLPGEPAQALFAPDVSLDVQSFFS